MLLSMAVIESSLESREVKSFDPILSSEPNLEPCMPDLLIGTIK